MINTSNEIAEKDSILVNTHATTDETILIPGTEEHSSREEQQFTALGIMTPSMLSKHCSRAGHQPYIIQHLIPEQSLSIVVGDSGLGKTPLLYQMSISIACGARFLDFPTQQKRVLYLDFENSLNDVNSIVTKITSMLEPNDVRHVDTFLRLWNVNGSDTALTIQTLSNLIDVTKPGMVVIDPITALVPTIESKNQEASSCYQELRKIMKSSACAIVAVHHLRKPDLNCRDCSLENSPRAFLKEARGASALINGADVRIGVDRSRNEESAIIVGGFARVSGDIPLIHLSRILDAEDEPIAYERRAGIALLSQSHKEAFEKLGSTFSHKEAKTALNRGPSSTAIFLRAAMTAGILKKSEGSKGYEKTAAHFTDVMDSSHNSKGINQLEVQ